MADGDSATVKQEHKLTTKQIAALKDELPEVDKEIDRINSEKQAANAKFAEDLKEPKKRRGEILKALDTGMVTTEIDAVEEMDWKNKRVLLKDSKGKVVGHRDMAPSEEQAARQTSIGDVQQGKHKPQAPQSSKPRAQRGRRRNAAAPAGAE